MRTCPKCGCECDSEARFCPRDGTALPSEAPSMVGQVLMGQFEILEEVGNGATGRVFKAVQVPMDRLVAVKFLKDEYAADPSVVRRFQREAKASARLTHANIITVHLVGRTEKGVPYLVMEFLQGEDLDSACKRIGAMEPAHVARLGRQIADALTEAHSNDVVHRDLKPANIKLCERRDRLCVKVLDFGIAKILEDGGTKESRLTKTGTVFGTPYYLSPEQASGDDVDHRADIYSLGVILYQMITGRLPFDSKSGLEVLVQHIKNKPPRPSEFRKDIPKGLEDIILRCLEKQPEKRYQNAEEIGDLLKPFEEDSAATAASFGDKRTPVTLDMTGWNKSPEKKEPDKSESEKATIFGMGGVAPALGLGVPPSISEESRPDPPSVRVEEREPKPQAEGSGHFPEELATDSVTGKKTMFSNQPQKRVIAAPAPYVPPVESTPTQAPTDLQAVGVGGAVGVPPLSDPGEDGPGSNKEPVVSGPAEGLGAYPPPTSESDKAVEAGGRDDVLAADVPAGGGAVDHSVPQEKSSAHLQEEAGEEAGEERSGWGAERVDAFESDFEMVRFGGGRSVWLVIGIVILAVGALATGGYFIFKDRIFDTPNGKAKEGKSIAAGSRAAVDAGDNSNGSDAESASEVQEGPSTLTKGVTLNQGMRTGSVVMGGVKFKLNLAGDLSPRKKTTVKLLVSPPQETADVSKGEVALQLVAPDGDVKLVKIDPHEGNSLSYIASFRWTQPGLHRLVFRYTAAKEPRSDSKTRSTDRSYTAWFAVPITSGDKDGGRSVAPGASPETEKWNTPEEITKRLEALDPARRTTSEPLPEIRLGTRPRPRPRTPPTTVFDDLPAPPDSADPEPRPRPGRPTRPRPRPRGDDLPPPPPD